MNLTTATTCNEQCWYAREEVCSCSCGGANHGALRVAGAEQPVRNSRVKNARYLLKAVGGPMSHIRSQGYDIARVAYRDLTDYRARYRDEKEHGLPSIVKRATQDQIDRWPELEAYRGGKMRPALLWVREDLAGIPEANR